VRDYAEGKQDWIGAALAVETEHQHNDSGGNDDESLSNVRRMKKYALRLIH